MKVKRATTIAVAAFHVTDNNRVVRVKTKFIRQRGNSLA